MFRRLLKLSESDNDSENAGSVPDLDHINETEGFVCPLCMTKFCTQIELEKHFESVHDKPTAQAPQSGFLCPTCKTDFNSGEELQVHFSTHLPESVVPNGPLCKDQMGEELAMFQQQLRASEDSRALLLSEIVLIREQMTEALGKNEELLAEKESYSLLVARLEKEAREGAGRHQAMQDHLQTLKGSLEEKARLCSGLESQLAERAGADDVNVLKKELVHAQTLMNQMTEEREREQAQLEERHHQLFEEHCALKEQISCSSSLAQSTADSCRARTHEALERQKDAPEFEHLMERGQKSTLELGVETVGQDKYGDTAVDHDKLEVQKNEILELRGQLEGVRASAETDQAALQAQILREQGQKEQLQQGNKTYQDNIAQLMGQLQLETSRFTDSVEEQRKLLEANERLEKELQELRACKEELCKEFEATKDDLRNKLRTLEKLVTKESETEHKLSAATAEIVNLQKKQSDLINKIEEGSGTETVIEQLQLQNREAEFKWHDLQEQLQKVKDTKSRELDELNELLNGKGKECKAKEELIIQVQCTLSEKMQLIEALQSTVSSLKSELMSRKEALVNLEEAKALQKADIEAHLVMAQAALKEKSTQLEEKSTQLEEKSTQLEEKSTQLKEKSTQLEEKSTQLEELHSKLNAELLERRAAEEQLSAEIRQLRELEAVGTAERKELEAARMKEWEELGRRNSEGRLQIEQLTERLREQQQVVIGKGGAISRLQAEKSELESTNRILEERVAGLDTAIAAMTEQAASARKASDQRLHELHELHAASLADRDDTVESLRQQLQSLMAQKGQAEQELEKESRLHEELNAKVEALSGQLRLQAGETKREVEEGHLEAKKLAEELLEARERLERERCEFRREQTAEQERAKELEDSLRKTEERHVGEQESLRENVRTLGAELSAARERLAGVESLREEAAAAKLASDMKVEAMVDERQALLQRCLASEESEAESAGLCTALRRKLDDAQAALHELGRQNQSLQIASNKSQNRRWADDRDALACFSCAKEFSLTTRKHHCRHCGNIYCFECSSKSAVVPANKKPVRVCDACYAELQRS